MSSRRGNYNDGAGTIVGAHLGDKRGWSNKSHKVNRRPGVEIAGTRRIIAPQQGVRVQPRGTATAAQRSAMLYG